MSFRVSKETLELMRDAQLAAEQNAINQIVRAGGNVEECEWTRRDGKKALIHIPTGRGFIFHMEHDEQKSSVSYVATPFKEADHER